MKSRTSSYIIILIVALVGASFLYSFFIVPINFPSEKPVKSIALQYVGAPGMNEVNTTVVVGMNEVNTMNELIQNGTVVQTQAAIAGAVKASIMSGGGGCSWTCDPGFQNVAGHCRNVCGGTITPITDSSGAQLSGPCSSDSNCPTGQTCEISLSTSRGNIGACVSPDTGQAAVGGGADVTCADMCTGYSWSGTIPAGEDDAFKCWSLNGWSSPEGCCCGPHSTYQTTALTPEQLDKAQGGPWKGLPAETIAAWFSPDVKAGQGASWNHELLCSLDQCGCCSRGCANAGTGCGGCNGGLTPARTYGTEDCTNDCIPLPGIHTLRDVCISQQNCFCPLGTSIPFPPGSSDLTGMECPGYTKCWDTSNGGANSCVGVAYHNCVWCFDPPKCLSGRTDGNYDCNGGTVSVSAAGSINVAINGDQCALGSNSQQNTATTTTTKSPGTFDGGKVTCTKIDTGVFRCTMAYKNNLDQDATVVFEYADANGNIVSSPESTAPVNNQTASSQFHCSAFSSGTYTVSWIAYEGEDFSISVDSSKSTELTTITCS